MATITPVVPDRPGGATLTGTLRSATEVAVAGGGDSIVLSGAVLLLAFRNGDASTHTITLNSQVNPSFPGGASSEDVNPAMTVVAGATRYVRIPQADFPRFANPTTGMLDVTYSSATSQFVEALSLS